MFHPQRRNRLPVLTLLLVLLIACGSCKNDPNKPQESACAGELGPPPEEDRWSAFTIDGGEEIPFDGGTEAEWDRSVGVITLSGGVTDIVIQVNEPVVNRPSFGCVVEIVQLIFGGVVVTLHDRDRRLSISHISDSAIAAVGIFQEGELSRLSFEAVNDCSGGPVTSSHPAEYKIISSSTPIDTLAGSTTKWDHNLGLVVLGPDSTDNAEHGLNMFVQGPIRKDGTKCVVTLISAELTIARERPGTTVFDVWFYRFPIEGQEIPVQNNLIEIELLNDGIIKGKGSPITMQKQTFSPTEGWIWEEIIQASIEFTAKEP